MMMMTVAEYCTPMHPDVRVLNTNAFCALWDFCFAEKLFPCPMCSLVCRDCFILQEHVELHLQEQANEGECDHCVHMHPTVLHKRLTPAYPFPVQPLCNHCDGILCVSKKDTLCIISPIVLFWNFLSFPPLRPFVA